MYGEICHQTRLAVAFAIYHLSPNTSAFESLKAWRHIGRRIRDRRRSGVKFDRRCDRNLAPRRKTHHTIFIPRLVAKVVGAVHSEISIPGSSEDISVILSVLVLFRKTIALFVPRGGRTHVRTKGVQRGRRDERRGNGSAVKIGMGSNGVRIREVKCSSNVKQRQ